MAEPVVQTTPPEKAPLCACAACFALIVECGPDHYPMYAKKLLMRGWAGDKSKAEKAYIKAHRRVA